MQVGLKGGRMDNHHSLFTYVFLPTHTPTLVSLEKPTRYGVQKALQDAEEAKSVE